MRTKIPLQTLKEKPTAELLAVFLSNNSAENALKLAQELLQEFGSLKKLLRAKPNFFMLNAAMELWRRYLEETLPLGEKLNNSPQTKRWIAARLRKHTQEVFACLFLDNQHRILAYEELFYGSINEVMVYPREIIKRALIHNAAKIILAHNHPSGDTSPSTTDYEITQLVKKALNLIDIVLIDHIIVGSNNCLSLAETGRI